MIRFQFVVVLISCLFLTSFSKLYSQINRLSNINIRPSFHLFSTHTENTDPDEINIDNVDMGEQAVEDAVKIMLNFNATSKKNIPSPSETFKDFYESIKLKKNNQTNQLDATQILESLFTEKPVREPFDDRKVITSLRQVLNTDDFSALFKDPNIGDLY